ncbi:MAG: aspartate--tRNA ligase, partial [Flavobacteriales bacterium]|nr:aspartate--tRNA ligase [Flavobacteriales bacterium]
IPTGEIEIKVEELTLLNASKTPPFTIEDETDGGEELRMKYRYLDIRRNPVKENLMLRAKVSTETRNFLNSEGFVEVETPYLIKSTPEGARDFVVPSRMNEGQFYALPQSPQTFKQLLMIAGMDKYYQIVKCFRDEDLRADRQPEFTQIDCEMAFVEQEDILNMFEGLCRHLLKEVKGVELSEFPRMTYDEAMKMYGSDKPDIRFGMKFVEINKVCQKNNFVVFDSAELVVGITVKDGASFTRKQLDKLTDFVKTPQVGAKGLVYCKCNEDGTFKSSVDKFFSQEDLNNWADECKASAGDLILVMAGEIDKTRKALSTLRLHLAEELGLRNPEEFAPLWVLDFPLLEWDEDTKRYHAMHHPFTSPKPNDIEKLDTNPAAVRANAYDLVLNGNEIGGGSIRIHDRDLQKLMFKHLGFTDEEAKEQFGFLMDAFEYGAPPHGGVAFGFDRLCAIMGGQESIRDFIAFPKNNSGRDVMIDSPSDIDEEQLKELNIKLR